MQLLGRGVYPRDPFLKPLHLPRIAVPRSMLVRPPLTVDAVDGGGLSASIAVTIDLTDMDEGGADEPANRAASFASGVNVGSSITATDPDDGDALNYTLSGTDASSFEIGGSTG